MDIENLTKQFTRFFVPGLALLFFALLLPTMLLGKDLFFGKEPPIGAAQAGFLSILGGYVLDSIRGYRWTLSIRQYKAERLRLSDELLEVLGESSTNPDDQIAILWKRDELTYNRIFVERAEWVMILETSFAMLVSAVVIIATGFYLHFAGNAQPWGYWLLLPFLVLASFLSSQNGIERMRAHNRKLVEAVKEMHKS